MKVLTFKKGGFEMKTRNVNRNLLVLAVATVAMSLTGCFKMGSLTGSNGSNSSNSTSSVTVPTNSSESPVLGLVRYDQTVATMKSLTGVKSPSGTTQTTITNNKANLSINGNPATDIGQPFHAAWVSIAADFCNDAITQNPSGIYPGITFSGASSQFSGATLTNVVNAMATNFWHRSPSSAEMTLIQNAVSGLTSGTTTQVGISLCASMLGSASALAN